MQKKDFYFSLSTLISDFLKLKNTFNEKKIDFDKKIYLENSLKIFEKVCSLKENKESEKNFKNNCIIFLKRIINDEFHISNKLEDIYSKYLFLNGNKEDIIKKEEEKNKQKIFGEKQAENENISNKKNNDMVFNIVLHNHKNKLKINEIEAKENKKNDINNQEINKDKQHKDKLDELLSNGKHIEFFNLIKKIYNNEDIKNIEPKKYLNSLFLKLKAINDKICNFKIDENYFLKYFTLLFSIYPFFSHEQKNFFLKAFDPKYNKNYLFYKQLLNNMNEDNNNILNLFYNFFLSNETNKGKILEKLYKNIFEVSPNNISLLYYSFRLMIILIIISKKYNEYYIIRSKFSIKLHFILSNYKYFSFNSEQFSKIFNDLLFMKHFYQNVYKKEINEPYLIKIKDNYLLYNNNLYNKDMQNISLLFDPKDNENYERIMGLDNGIIPHFYNINEINNKQLIDSSSFLIKQQSDKFFDNIISLTYIKSEYIEKNFNKYIENLKNLEKEIFELAQDFLVGRKDKNTIKNPINQYSPKIHEKNIYTKFVYELDKWMKNNYKNKFKNKYMLCPVGSLTEFLSLGESDIDIYLYLNTENLDEKVEIVEAIYNYVRQIYKKSEPIISQRLLVITFVYENISFDLSVLGYPLYIHSLLHREYSLIDSRFPMVGLAIKKLKEILELDKNTYINSFCWMNLLVIFLQDIIKPPILPKLYSDKDINKLIYQDIEFGHNNKNRIKSYNWKKSFKNFFLNIKKEKIPIPDCIFNKNKVLEIYKKEIGQNKNELSCSEILLKFIEFIAFYFKYDTIYAECSINEEGFLNLNEIKDIYFSDKNNNIDEKMQKYNYEFYKYFTRTYLNHYPHQNKKQIRNGFILIRDPVDNHYNPGQKFGDENELEEFIKRLRYYYSFLIKYGSFKKLQEKINEKKIIKKSKENNIKY